ncbi:MAG TPA: hypothetical protein VEI82_09370 [Myxococcota bacterium]|nr:hypothetical protein [Myxococcota bacterium]
MDSDDIRYPPGLRWGRALATFAGAYAAITLVATAIGFGISALVDGGPVAHPLDDPGYQLTEKLLPALNLAVWTPFAALYFAGRGGAGRRGEALALGALWLAVALPVDYLGFVVLETPLSLSAREFYVGQFPWIYLIYLAVLASPLCALALAKTRTRPGA